MGRVYQARDGRLGRNVAIKVSHDRFSQRFTREARAIAQLSHSNICTLYDIGPNYLVMECVEGGTLEAKISSGPLPIPEAIDIAVQIAQDLRFAHAKQILHRDINPANVMITARTAVSCYTRRTPMIWAPERDPTSGPFHSRTASRSRLPGPAPGSCARDFPRTENGSDTVQTSRRGRKSS